MEKIEFYYGIEYVGILIIFRVYINVISGYNGIFRGNSIILSK